MKEREPYTLLVGKYIGTAAVENSMDISQKTKNRITILYTIYISLLGIYLKKILI